MSTILKWGLITGMVYVVFFLISNLLGLQQSMGGSGGNMALGFLVQTVLMLATFFTIYLGTKETRDEDKGGYLTLGEGFIAGFKMALIASVVAGLFTFIYIQFIDPTMLDKAMSVAEDQWDEAGMDEDQIEMSKKFTGYIMNPFAMSAITLVSVIFWGVIKALIAGSMLKKLAPPSAAFHDPNPTTPSV